ncbi:MAG: hypothetical protein V1725_01310 [archaeon]
MVETKQVYGDEDLKTLQDLRGLKTKLSSSDMMESMRGLEQALAGGTVDLRQQKETQLAKLNTMKEGFQAFQAFQDNIGTLTSGLAEKLNQYTEFMGKVGQYEGSEKLVKWFWPSKAKQWRNERLKTQTPEQNLRTIIKYATAVVSELLQVRAVAIKQYEGLASTVELLAKKLELSQPKQAELKEKLDALEAQYKALEEQLETADPATRVKLETELKDLKHGKIVPTQSAYDEVSMIYKIAGELMEPNKVQRDNYSLVIRNFGIAANQIREKVEDGTQILLAGAKAKKLMEIAEATVDTNQSFNYATQESLRIGSQMAQVIKDRITSETEKETVAAEVVKTLIDKLKEEVHDFDVRYGKVIENSQRTLAERYANSSSGDGI